MSNYIKEAFRELELLDEEVFPIDDEVDDKLTTFLDDDSYDDVNVVIDTDAESEEDLEDSYEGKVILSCVVCHDMQYKDPEDVVIDEVSPELVNVGEECPVCSSSDGFKIVGQVAPYSAKSDEVEEDELENTVEIDTEETQSNEIDEVEESLSANKEKVLYEDVSKYPIQALKDAQEAMENEEYEYGYSMMQIDDIVDSIAYDVVKDKYGKDAFMESSLQMGEGNVDVRLKDGTVYRWDYSDEADYMTDKIYSAKSWQDIYDAFNSFLDNYAYEVTEDDVVEECMDKVSSNCDKECTHKGIRIKNRHSKHLNEKRETGLGDVVQQMLDGEFYDNVVSQKTGKIQSVARPTLYSPDVIGYDGKGLTILVDDEEAAKPAKEIADKFSLSTYYEPAKSWEKDRRGVFHIYISDEDWDKDVSDIAYGESLTEAVDNISIETDSNVINVQPQPDGNLSIETASVEDTVDVEVESEETIAPVDDEVQTEIESSNIEAEEEEEDSDIDISDIDISEEDFDSLGESYLKKIYDNVESYSTTAVTKDASSIICEGIIKFTSGKKAKTSFVFENLVRTNKGKVKLIGENIQLSKNKKAFTLTFNGTKDNMICESFNYNYMAKDSKSGKSVPVYGTIKKA